MGRRDLHLQRRHEVSREGQGGSVQRLHNRHRLLLGKRCLNLDVCWTGPYMGIVVLRRQLRVFDCGCC
jgi:hypothetical protein